MLRGTAGRVPVSSPDAGRCVARASRRWPLSPPWAVDRSPWPLTGAPSNDGALRRRREASDVIPPQQRKPQRPRPGWRVACPTYDLKTFGTTRVALIFSAKVSSSAMSCTLLGRREIAVRSRVESLSTAAPRAARLEPGADDRVTAGRGDGRNPDGISPRLGRVPDREGRRARAMRRAHLLRWRPRQPAQRTESTPRRLPSGAASQLDPCRALASEQALLRQAPSSPTAVSAFKARTSRYVCPAPDYRTTERPGTAA